jgi:hypothetical protein
VNRFCSLPALIPSPFTKNKKKFTDDYKNNNGHSRRSVRVTNKDYSKTDIFILFILSSSYAQRQTHVRIILLATLLTQDKSQANLSAIAVW